MLIHICLYALYIHNHTINYGDMLSVIPGGPEVRGQYQKCKFFNVN